MPEETNWDDIFRPNGVESPRPAPLQQVSVEPVSQQFPTARLSDPFAVAAAEATATAAVPIQRPAGPVQGQGLVPTTRRELRESGGGGGGRRGRGSGGSDGKRSKRWIGWLVGVTTVFALIAVGGVYAWTNYEDKIREVLGWELPNDYTGEATASRPSSSSSPATSGETWRRLLEAAKVTMTFDAVYNYLLAHPDISFQPGNYTLQQEMSAEAAITALQDPANKIINSVTIPEGTTAPAAYELISVRYRADRGGAAGRGGQVRGVRRAGRARPASRATCSLRHTSSIRASRRTTRCRPLSTRCTPASTLSRSRRRIASGC